MSRGRALVLAVALTACGKTVAFQGESTFAITGSPPAAEPVAEQPRVEVRDNAIQINQKIQFAYDRADILPASFDLMNEIVSVIQKNPHIKKIQIEGHASSEGDANHNQQLSQARARSVMKYLVDKGVDKARLTAKGFGIDRPIADNSTEAGREANRRVEMNILEQDVTTKRVEIDKTGKEKILEEKKATVNSAAGAS